MNYLTLFTPHNLALLSDWLAETGELYVNAHKPHSGGGGDDAYLVRSLQDLKALVSQITWPELLLTIFRQMQYPLRGIADNRLLEQALQQIRDGQSYAIISLDSYYPSQFKFLGSGKGHNELRTEFAEVVGQDPLDIYGFEWFRSHPDDFFTLAVYKNQRDYYESYAKHPERYKAVEDLWRQ